ncbi:MAG: serine/threonine protein kinase, partial [Nostoc sp.]
TTNANTYASWFYRIIIPLLLLASISAIVLPIFARTDLQFDREKFQIKWKLFGFCYKQKSGKTKLIRAIYQEEAKAALAPLGITIELIKGKKLTTTPLATVERHWLVDEIADWLEF